MELPEGRLLDPPNLPGWENFELRQELEKNLGIAVLVENDANVAALAECVLGQGKQLNVSSLCMLTLGTGVGTGIVLDSKIWHGMNGMAGEAGHISVVEGGVQCNCGTRGCLEVYASATGLTRLAREYASADSNSALAKLQQENPGFTSNDLFELALAGDTKANSIFQFMGCALGRGLATLVNTLNLSAYVIGGGVASAWQLFAPSMFANLFSLSSIYRLTDPDQQLKPVMARARTLIVPAQLGPDAGILGACHMALSANHAVS